MEVKEQIVLNPKNKTANSTTLWIERKVSKDVTPNDKVYVAGGDHRGIVINKETKGDQQHIVPPAHLSLEFRVYLVNGQTGMHTQEVRTLRFWFRDVFHSQSDRAAVAQEFFRCLIQPKEFPRNYVGFIKKIMKLLQHGFQGIVRIELVLCQLETSELPERPRKFRSVLIDTKLLERWNLKQRKHFAFGYYAEVLVFSSFSPVDDNSRSSFGCAEDILNLTRGETKCVLLYTSSTDESDPDVAICLSEEKVVEVVEHYYPNPITVTDLSKEYGWDEDEVKGVLNRLEEKRIIKSMEHGAYTRVTQGDIDVKVVKQMPRMVKAHQPTIAIITAQFTEKLAFDAMIDNKETFVRYTTVGSDNGGTSKRFGESNLYTLGNIGDHRVVCTKLPSVGNTREATTAAGNTTTRLLGTFQDVDHVFLVGVGGGVPHFTDYNKHVRLGDVVISHAAPNSECIYVNCQGATETAVDHFRFEVKKYRPKITSLQHAAAQLKVDSTMGGADAVWKCLEDGLRCLESESEHNFQRPPADSDKLYMALGERDLIEVSHPAPQGRESPWEERRPRLHLGVVGAGREVARWDELRQKFCQEHEVAAFVSEFDPVIESITGNCRDSFIFVRGISDYKDGTKKTDWQPYAALAAASVAKAIISSLDPMMT